MTQPADPPPPRQPAFNLPTVVVVTIAILLGIHAVREYLLSSADDFGLVFALAFIPARITAPETVAAVLPGGVAADVWTFVTYAALHADWTHVGLNCLWLAAFGSPLAWRFGAVRFLTFSVIGAIAGAALHLALHPSDLTPLVGASAAISAHMAGACRFVFAAGGPIGAMPMAGAGAYRRPAVPLLDALRDSRVLIFLGAWFGTNLLFGLFGQNTGLASGAIAWEAHIGGFFVGLLFFPVFDPVGTEPPRAA
jgi:membrane associated rhomboid family serine protease